MYKIIKSLRSLETEKTYQNFLKSPRPTECFLCRAQPIKEFEHWKIVENEFPYDGIATKSHIIAPKNHKTEDGFTENEKTELLKIKKDLGNQYDMIIENGTNNQSIPQHFHLHLIVLKERKVEVENPVDTSFLKKKEILVAC
jgi:diadenosine tetraphosphate (Ap4A) HIT family hydrolase